MVEEKVSVHEGYMFMQNQTMWRSWSSKARYLILTNECLYSFKRRGDLRSIPHDVVHLDDISVMIDELKRGFRKRYYIRLNSTRQRKSFNLFCFSIEERNEWFSKILSVLAEKFTNNILNEPIKQKSLKSQSMLGDTRHTVLLALEQKRPMSISCIELTNLGVIEDNTQNTVTPILKLMAQQNQTNKKVSSSSLDAAIRTDCHSKRYSSSLLKVLTRDDYKRPQSMCENPTFYLDSTRNNKEENSPQKKSRKQKTLSVIWNSNNNLMAA